MLLLCLIVSCSLLFEVDISLICLFSQGFGRMNSAYINCSWPLFCSPCSCICCPEPVTFCIVAVCVYYSSILPFWFVVLRLPDGTIWKMQARAGFYLPYGAFWRAQDGVILHLPESTVWGMQAGASLRFPDSATWQA